MKSRALCIALALIVVPLALSAETLSKIAVVDWAQIIENFPGGSPALRRIENLQAEYEGKIEGYIGTLRQKELALREAETDDNETGILRAREELDRYQEFIKTYHEFMTAKMNREIETVKKGSVVADMIYEAISHVGINEGYSMIFDAAERGLLWFSNEVDLTDEVIEYLQELARREQSSS